MGLGAAFQIAYNQRVLGNEQDDRVAVNFFGDGTCNVGAPARAAGCRQGQRMAHGVRAATRAVLPCRSAPMRLRVTSLQASSTRRSTWPRSTSCPASLWWRTTSGPSA